MFEELHRKMNSFWNNDRTLSETDPEFIKLFSDFAYDEVVNERAPWRFLPCWSDARALRHSR